MRHLHVLATIALAGCASAPQPLPDQQYRVYAGHIVGLQKCGTSGRMDTALAGFGLANVRAKLGGWAYDQNRMHREVDSVDRLGVPSIEACNELAMQYAELKRRAEADSQASRAASPGFQNTQTTCNRVFGQVHCNSWSF